jgi:hypothetical protein
VQQPNGWPSFSWDSIKQELETVELSSTLDAQQQMFGPCIKNPIPVATSNVGTWESLYLLDTIPSFPGGRGLTDKFILWVLSLSGHEMKQATSNFLGALYNVQLAGKTKVCIM